MIGIDENATQSLKKLFNDWYKIILFISQAPLLKQKRDLDEFNKLFAVFSENMKIMDKRFKHEGWQNNILLNFIKQSYLLLLKQVEALINQLNKNNPQEYEIQKKLKFFSKQILDAISPSNFAILNPEILAKISETNGANLIKGFEQFLTDLKEGRGNIAMTDLDRFKVGTNIACTPGHVIYENDIMQLIHYTPITEKIYQFPLLIIPPWINKYYILDLQQENSFVKWLLTQGFSVYMISWVNATSDHQYKEFEDYLLDGPLMALQQIKTITKESQINILGYCIGGTLSACMLAYLAKMNDFSVRSATFLTTLLDFSEPGDLGIFISREQLAVLKKHMDNKGYLDGRIMTAIFNSLRANDLIWNFFINNYLKGQKPEPFDLLYWNSDSTNIPAKVHNFYLQNMYINNLLTKKNKIKLAEVSIDISEINIPSYFLAALNDHIVPWTSAYQSSLLFKSNIRFVLTNSGHVAGVVNPPQKNKYGYWINQLCSTPQEFLKTANFMRGSWWNNWLIWQKKFAGRLYLINNEIQHKANFIDTAPGSYVKVTIADILTPNK